MRKAEAFRPLVIAYSLSVVVNAILLRSATSDAEAEEYVHYRPVYFDVTLSDGF